MGGGSGTATWQSALLGLVISTFGSRRIAFLLAESRREDLVDIGELFEEGKVIPVVDRCYHSVMRGKLSGVWAKNRELVKSSSSRNDAARFWSKADNWAAA